MKKAYAFQQAPTASYRLTEARQEEYRTPHVPEGLVREQTYWESPSNGAVRCPGSGCRPD